MMWSTRSTPASPAWWAMDAARYSMTLLDVTPREAPGVKPQSWPLGKPWSGGAPTDIPSAKRVWRDHGS